MFKIGRGKTGRHRRRTASTGGVRGLFGLVPWPAGWRSWWQRKSRPVRHFRQDAATYALFVLIAGTSVTAVVLWASGVFALAGERLGAATQSFLADKGLAIEQVSVTGRTYADKSRLQTALGVERGMSLLHFDIHEARARLEDVDWVDQATVMRLWPDTLRIALVERRPIAIWQLNGELMLIDRDGLVISGEHLGDFANLPHVVGAGAATAAADLIALMNAHPDIRSRLRAAVRVGGRRWNLRLDNGIDVKLPDRGEGEALHLLTEIDRRHRLFGRDIVEIDLRVPKRLFLKLRSEDVVDFDASGVET